MASGVPVASTRRRGRVLLVRLVLVAWAVFVYVAYVLDQLPRFSGFEGPR